MFHHLRRLGRGCAPPCRLCLRAFTACKAPAAPHPSVGCLGGPVLRLRRKTTRIPYASVCACDAWHPNPTRNHALRLGAVPGFRVVLRLSARRDGALPPIELSPRLSLCSGLAGVYSTAPPSRLPPAPGRLCLPPTSWAPTGLHWWAPLRLTPQGAVGRALPARCAAIHPR